MRARIRSAVALPNFLGRFLRGGRREPSSSAAERGKDEQLASASGLNPAVTAPEFVSGSRHAYGGEHRPYLRKVGTLVPGRCGAPARSGADRAAVISVGVTKRSGTVGKRLLPSRQRGGSCRCVLGGSALPRGAAFRAAVRCSSQPSHRPDSSMSFRRMGGMCLSGGCERKMCNPATRGTQYQKEPFVRSAIPALILVFGLAILVLTSLFFFVNVCNKLSEITSLLGQTYDEHLDCNRPRVRESSVDFRVTEQISF